MSNPVQQPEVRMVCLYADRSQFLPRLLDSFRSQTYENKRLLIYDNGTEPLSGDFIQDHQLEILVRGGRQSIGALRNSANSLANAEIIAHADVDDWSHPNRLAEQVALLQSSGADLVGYNEALFWDTRWKNTTGPQGGVWLAKRDEAWLYRYPNPAYCLGSSFLYWRKTWERQPFDDVNHGEDERFRLKVKSVGISSLQSYGATGQNCMRCKSDRGGTNIRPDLHRDECPADNPRMICAIHGGNTSHYAPERDRAMWRRAENWDSACERMMKL